MNTFYLNGLKWTVIFVSPYSNLLIDRTGTRTVATTDPSSCSIYISCKLHGNFLKRVLTHEIGHCVMISYNILNDIHRIVKPKYWLYAEESLCNYIVDHGKEIETIVNKLLY